MKASNKPDAVSRDGIMRKPSSKSKPGFTLAVIASVTLAFLVGCGNPAEVAVKKLFKPSPDKDVTTSPEYNFSSFTNTVWKTKEKVAIADLKRYTGAQEIKLLAPDCFDPTHPRYNPPADMQFMAVLPVGTRLRIARLMQDQGAWGGVQVEAVLEGVTNNKKAVYLDGYLLAGNRWVRGPYSNTNWDANPDMLESSGNSDQSAPSASGAADTPRSGYKRGYGNGRACAILAQKAVAGNHLSDPWLGKRDWRPLAVRVHGEDYVAAYESGYSKGFHDYTEEKR